MKMTSITFPLRGLFFILALSIAVIGIVGLTVYRPFEVQAPLERTSTTFNGVVASAREEALRLLHPDWTEAEREMLLDIITDDGLEAAYANDALVAKITAVNFLIQNSQVRAFVNRHPVTLTFLSQSSDPARLVRTIEASSRYFRNEDERHLRELQVATELMTDIFPAEQEARVRSLEANRVALTRIRDGEIFWLFQNATNVDWAENQHPQYTRMLEMLISDHQMKRHFTVEVADAYLSIMLNFLNTDGKALNQALYRRAELSSHFRTVEPRIRQLIVGSEKEYRSFWNDLPACENLDPTHVNCRHADIVTNDVFFFTQAAVAVLHDPRIWLAVSDDEFFYFASALKVPIPSLLSVYWGEWEEEMSSFKHWSLDEKTIYSPTAERVIEQFLNYQSSNANDFTLHAFLELHSSPDFVQFLDDEQLDFYDKRCLALDVFSRAYRDTISSGANSSLETQLNVSLARYDGDTPSTLRERCGLSDGDRFYEYIPGGAFVEIARKSMIGIPPDTGDWVGAGFDTLTAITLIVPPISAGVHAVGQTAKASIKVSAKSISRSASKRALAELDTAILLATRQATKSLVRSGGSEIIDISLRNAAAKGKSGIGRKSLEILENLGRKLGLDSNGFVVLFPDHRLAGHAANVTIFQTAENFAYSQAFKTAAAANLTDAAKRSLADLSVLWWQHDEALKQSEKAQR